MNTGIMATRYAKALLLYCEESGNGEKVCSQVRELLRNPDVSSLKLEPELERFVALVSKRGRMQYIRFMLSSFVAMYLRSKGIKLARLVTSSPVPGLEERVKAMLHSQFNCEIRLESEVDPGLLGGFLIIVDDEYMLDASIKNQIDTIRRQFIIQNNRIV